MVSFRVYGSVFVHSGPPGRLEAGISATRRAGWLATRKAGMQITRSSLPTSFVEPLHRCCRSVEHPAEIHARTRNQGSRRTGRAHVRPYPDVQARDHQTGPRPAHPDRTVSRGPRGDEDAGRTVRYPRTQLSRNDFPNPRRGRTASSRPAKRQRGTGRARTTTPGSEGNRIRVGTVSRGMKKGPQKRSNPHPHRRIRSAHPRCGSVASPPSA